MVHSRRPGNGQAAPTMGVRTWRGLETISPPLWAGGGRGGVGVAFPPFPGSASRSPLHLLFLLQVGSRPAPAGHASGKRPPAPSRSGPGTSDPDLVSHLSGLSRRLGQPNARAGLPGKPGAVTARRNGVPGRVRFWSVVFPRTKPTHLEVRPGGPWVRSFARESGGGEGCEMAKRRVCGGQGGPWQEGSEGALRVCPDKNDPRVHWNVCYESVRT